VITPARKLDASDLQLVRGTVTGRLDQHYVVSESNGRPERRARRAVSCLVEPVNGDTVLVALGSEQAHILAVLEREQQAGATTLSVDGDLELRAAGKLEMDSEQLTVRASKAEVVLDAVQYAGGVIDAALGRMRTVASTAEIFVDELQQHARQVFRFIDEGEHVRAGTVDYEAKSTLRHHGQNTITTAEELVKVDGGQIHLG